MFIWYSNVAHYLFGQLFDVWNVIKKINCFKHSFSFSILIKKFYSVTVLRWVTNATIPPSLCCAESTAVWVYHQCHHCSTAAKAKNYKKKIRFKLSWIPCPTPKFCGRGKTEALQFTPCLIAKLVLKFKWMCNCKMQNPYLHRTA